MGMEKGMRSGFQEKCVASTGMQTTTSQSLFLISAASPAALSPRAALGDTQECSRIQGLLRTRRKHLPGKPGMLQRTFPNNPGASLDVGGCGSPRPGAAFLTWEKEREAKIFCISHLNKHGNVGNLVFGVLCM